MAEDKICYLHMISISLIFSTRDILRIQSPWVVWSLDPEDEQKFRFLVAFSRRSVQSFTLSNAACLCWSAGEKMEISDYPLSCFYQMILCIYDHFSPATPVLHAASNSIYFV